MDNNQTGEVMRNIVIKRKITKWYQSFIRDRWGNIKTCYWNTMAKQEILKLEAKLNQNS